MSNESLRRYRVTVILPRPPGDDALLPPGAHGRAKLTAAVTGKT